MTMQKDIQFIEKMWKQVSWLLIIVLFLSLIYVVVSIVEKLLGRGLLFSSEMFTNCLYIIFMGVPIYLFLWIVRAIARGSVRKS